MELLMYEKHLTFLVTNESPGDKNAEVCDANELKGKPFSTLRCREGGLGFQRDCAGDRGGTRGHKGILWGLLVAIQAGLRNKYFEKKYIS